MPEQTKAAVHVTPVTEEAHGTPRKPGLTVARRWTRPGIHPYDEITWELRTATISNEKGEIVFEQKDVEVPSFWTQLATNVVVSKYFRGALGTPQRERSVKQLINRVANTIADWGVKDGYFAGDEDAKTFRDELTYLLVNQYTAFNSPVWFNVGIEPRPQCSACFILSVDDTMDSILEWYRNEGMIFKYGSGSGLNVSPIRSARERLAGGGTASGPVSFMKAADASAGVIKSGGKTRRAAKMVVLNADHPDVQPFILCKWKEEEKAHKLIDIGYDASIDGEAYGSVFFQNANNSVRVTDEFMRRALADEEWDLKAVTTGEIIERVKAKDLLRLIAEATWHCGDPGMQYDTTVNDWHTCPNTGRINASNPCSEYMHLDNSACIGPEVRVSTKHGLLPVSELYRRQEAGETIYIKTELLSEHAAVPRRGKPGYRPADVYARQLAFRPAVVIKTGRKLLYRVELSTGQSIRLTADHKVLTENGWKEVRQLEVGRDAIVTQKQSTPIDYSEATPEQIQDYHLLGWMTGDGYCSENGERPAFGLVFGPQDRTTAEYLQPVFNRLVHEHTRAPWRDVGISTQRNGVMQIGSTAQAAFAELVERYGVHPATAPYKRLPSCVFEASKTLQATFLGALFSADGTIFLRKPGAHNKPFLLVRLTSTSPQLLRDAQILLFDFGIRSSVTWTHPEGRKNPQGTLSIHGYHAYKFCQMIGFPLSEQKRAVADEAISDTYGGKNYAGRRAAVNHVVEDGVDDVYDISEPVTHSMIAEGMIIHNCNLASINLMKFLDDEGNFLIEPFKYATQVMILAQDIVVDNSSYPTAKITQTARDYRELGLGYANLGAMLMSMGLAYDSDAGRSWAGAITAIMCGHAYEVSGRIAAVKGPYAGFERNREPQVRVLRKHRAQVDKINTRLIPEPLWQAAARTWDEAICLGEGAGVRNSQVTVIAPTGCLVGGSLVATDQGLMRLDRLGNVRGVQWQDVSFRVLTDDGPRAATKFYVNGQASTRRIRTEAGHEICGTPQHRVKVVNPVTGQWVWKRLEDIASGDVVPLGMNTLIGEPRSIALPPLGEPYWASNPDIEVPRTVTPELGEFVGYFMGDGSLHSKGLRFCVTAADEDVVERLRHLGRTLFHAEAHVTSQEGYTEVAFHSVALVIWWEACGFAKRTPTDVPNHSGKGYHPHTPDAILATNDAAVYRAFLRGLFEADGSVIFGVPSLATARPEFAREVATMLLSLGYPTSAKVDQSGWGAAEVHVLRIRNRSYNELFLREIGFLSRRKTQGLVVQQGPLSGKRDYVFLPEEVVDELVPAGTVHHDAVLMSVRRHGGIPRLRARQLFEETRDPRLSHALQFFYDRVVSNEDGGVQPTYDLSVPENTTYLANGFVSHNTIAFLMDCDTTGIEPDIALIKYKRLVGGGMLKIVNQTVPRALKNLGYDSAQVDAILKFLNEKDTIEGAPGLKSEHLPVFDCAFKPIHGIRTIHYMGHLRMMGAVQPFISGAISKTINMPQEATVEETILAYTEAWKLGLKAVAIYRDGSKRVQPLSTGKGGDEKKAPAGEPYRRRLPDTREAVTHKFAVGGHEGYITVGLFEDGKPGEIFITMSKEGSTLSGLVDSFSTAVSLALQYGVPLEVLVNKFSHVRFEPSGITNNKDVRFAKSVVDYIFRWMALRFLPADQAEAFKVTELPGAPAKAKGALAAAKGVKSSPSTNPFEQQEKLTFVSQADAPMCSDCGSIMVRNGACYKCLNCGSTSGCS